MLGSFVFTNKQTGTKLLANIRDGSMAQVLIHKVLGGRLVRSGVIYWSQYVEGLIVMGVVYIAANPKGSAGGGQPRAYMPSGCLRPQLSSPS